MFVPIVLPLGSQIAALVQDHTTRYWPEAAFLALRSELPRPLVGQSVASRVREGQ